MIYFAIVFCASVVGSMGGGVLIKPLLDMMGTLDLASIGVLSAVAVTILCGIGLYINSKENFKVDLALVLITIGSILGGFLGNFLFILFMEWLPEMVVNSVQIVITLILLAFCVLQKRFKSFSISNPIAFGVAGLLLGSVATFIGIGGGPMNIATMGVFFGFSIKKSVRCSLFIAFFSQATALVTTSLGGGFGSFELTSLIYIIPAAILGGIAGGVLVKKISANVTHILYLCIVYLLIVLNLYNLVVLMSIG